MWQYRVFQFAVGIVAMMLVGGNAAAQLVEQRESIELRGESSLSSSFEARKDIQKQLIEQLGVQLAKDLLGEELYQKKRRQIERVVNERYGQFIPFIQPADLQRTSKGFSQSIRFEVSRSSLRDILSMEGLLYDQLREVKVLPLISYLDAREAKSFKWWMGEEPSTEATRLLLQTASLLETKLREEIWQQSFYYFDPRLHRSHVFLAPELKVDSHRLRDQLQLGRDLGAELLIVGGVRISQSLEHLQASQLHLDLKAVLATNEREIARVEKKIETEIGDLSQQVVKAAAPLFDEQLKDLMEQVRDAYEKGKFGTKTYRLLLLGRLPVSDFFRVKKQIEESSYQIKALRERLLSAGRFEFEMDISGELAPLQKRLADLKLEGYEFKISATNDAIAMELQRN